MVKPIYIEKCLLIIFLLSLISGTLILSYNFFYYSDNIKVVLNSSPLYFKNNLVVKELSPVNINNADEKGLVLLPGIGPTLAKRIVEYRSLNGKISNIKELLNIKGIGESKLKNIRRFIILE